MRVLLVALFAAIVAVVASDGGTPAHADSLSSVSTGGFHSCGMTSDGGVECWGSNEVGDAMACNDPYAADPTVYLCAYPNEVSGFSSGALGVSAGFEHVCAVTSSGRVRCWGDNSYGQVGNGASGGEVPMPTDVVGLSDGVVAVSAGGRHTCALTVAGSIKCWGYNAFGQLGGGAACGYYVCPTPVDVTGLGEPAVAVFAGGYHSCAIMMSDAVKCWGSNVAGQLGTGTATGPETCTGGAPPFGDSPCSTTPVDVAGLTNGVDHLSAGLTHTCAVTSLGGAVCWGDNGSGQLGSEAQPNCPSPYTACSPTPIDVTGLTSGVNDISAGGGFSCAINGSGSVTCWGDLLFLSDEPCSVYCPNPIDVPGLSSGVVTVSAGANFSCATTAAGETKCWGDDTHFALGDGRLCGNYCTTPVEVRYDNDDDGCPDSRELRIPNGSEYAGGRRDPDNGNDYFNPSHDGKNRIDDVVLVLHAYFKDDNDGNPGLPPYVAGYNPGLDRTLLGPNNWNLGPPNGLQRIDDILNQLHQYYHDCS